MSAAKCSRYFLYFSKPCADGSSATHAEPASHVTAMHRDEEGREAGKRETEAERRSELVELVRPGPRTYFFFTFFYF